MPKTVVSVNIRRENGWYIATSPDLQELIICHQNVVKFYQEIPVCIKGLFRLNRDMDVEVEELTSLDNHDVSHVVFEATKKAA